MGFLDKLREKLEEVLETGDSPKKKYYDFILNVLTTANCMSEKDIKKCYKAKMGEDCDEAVLSAVLEKFETSKVSRSDVTWYQRTTKQVFDERVPESQWLFKTVDEIYDLCYSDFRESVRARFAEVLDTVKGCADDFHLEQACEAMMKYPSSPCPHTTLAGQVMGGEMIRLFFANDPTAVSIVMKCLYSNLVYSYSNYSEKTIALLYAIALRAMHFEQFGTAEDGYVSITAEDCTNAVLNSKYYQKQIAETPYYKDSIVTCGAKAILETKPIYSTHDWTWDCWAIKNPRFVDAACHKLWKQLSSGSENADTKNVEEAVLVINEYVRSHN